VNGSDDYDHHPRLLGGGYAAPNGRQLTHGLESKGYLRSFHKRGEQRARRIYRATATGRKALEAAKLKVKELVGELFEDE